MALAIEAIRVWVVRLGVVKLRVRVVWWLWIPIVIRRLGIVGRLGIVRWLGILIGRARVVMFMKISAPLIVWGPERLLCIFYWVINTINPWK